MANEKRRLIDAKSLEKQIKQAFEDINPYVMGQMLRWVRKQPKVDAEEVVRCRDCISRVWDSEVKEYWCDNPLGLCAMLNDGDFCSYGERKDDEHRTNQRKPKADHPCSGCV